MNMKKEKTFKEEKPLKPGTKAFACYEALRQGATYEELKEKGAKQLARAWRYFRQEQKSKV